MYMYGGYGQIETLRDASYFPPEKVTYETYSSSERYPPRKVSERVRSPPPPPKLFQRTCRQEVVIPDRKWTTPPRSSNRSPVRSRTSPTKRVRSWSRSPERKKHVVEPSRNGDTDYQKIRDKSASEEGEILVKNLPRNISTRDVNALFDNQIGDVTYFELFDSGRSAIVRFKTQKHSKKAIEKLHNTRVNDKRIQIIDTSASSSSASIPQTSRSHSHIPFGSGIYAGDSKGEQTFGLSQKFLDSLKIDLPLVPKVEVQGLDSRITPFKLTEIFNIAGNVRHVDIKYDLEGRNKGSGFVVYKHPVEAVQAISMLHDQHAYGRRLKVVMSHDKGGKLKVPEGIQTVGNGLGIDGVPLKDIAKIMKAVQEKKSSGQKSDTKSVVCLTDDEGDVSASGGQSRRDQKSHYSRDHSKPVASPPLRMVNSALKTLENNVLQMACSAEGVEILNQKLEKGSEEEVRVIMNQVSSSFMTLVTDIRGALLILKLLEVGSTAQKEQLLNLLKTKGPGFKGLAYHKVAYKVIRKAIEIFPLPFQLDILESFKGHVISLAKHINGRHVIEACLETMGANYTSFIIQEISGHVLELLRDMDGFLVIQKILLQLPVDLSGPVFKEIIQCARNIIADPCGIKIFSLILENGHANDAYQVIEGLKGVFIFLSQNQWAGPILSKCISLACTSQIDNFIDEVCGMDDAGLVVMMKDEYAQLILLDLVRACNVSQRKFLIGKINRYMSNMLAMPYGKSFSRTIHELESKMDHRPRKPLKASRSDKY